MIRKLKKIFDPESKKLAKNSSWVLMATMYQVASSFVKSMILARTLGVELYGLFAVIMAFVSTFGEVFSLHFGPALVKYTADYRTQDRLDKVFALFKLSYISSFVAAFACILTIFLSLVFFYDVFFDVAGLFPSIMLFAASFSLSLINGIPLYLLMVHDKYNYSSTLTVVGTSIELCAIGISLLFFGQDIHTLIGFLAVGQVLAFFVYNLVTLSKLKESIYGFWSKPVNLLRSDYRSIFNFIVNNSLSKTVQKMLKKGDILLLAAFTGNSEVGMYDVAKKLSFAFLMIKDPLIVAVYPQIARLVSDEKVQELRVFLRNIGLLSIVPYVIGATVLFFSGDWIIATFFGEEFVGAGIILFILVLAVGLDIVFFWTVPYILSLGKAGFRLKASIASAVVSLLLGLILVNSFGATGVAVSLFIGALLLQGLFLTVIFSFLSQQK